MQSSTQKYRTPSRLQNEIKKIIVVLKSKKEIYKNIQFNFLCLVNSICVRVQQVAFVSEDWKKLSVWSSVLFTISTLKMREREAYRKQTGSSVPLLLNKVSASEHDRFMQVSLYTVSWLLANT